MTSSECSATIAGIHTWNYRQKQIQPEDGTRYAPWVKDSFVRYIGCVCGAEAPESMHDEIKAQWRKAKEAGKWFSEAGEQQEMSL